MTPLELEKFKKILLEEVINEVNRKQHIPVTFYDIELEEKTPNKFEGLLSCVDCPNKTWKISILAEIQGDEVLWNANELEWYRFDLSSHYPGEAARPQNNPKDLESE